MNRSSVLILFLSTALGLALMAGCEQDTSASRGPKTAEPVAASDTEPSNLGDTADHAHVAGAHGGTIVPIGADSYHAEVVVESNGTIRLLTLGKDETRIQSVEVQTLKAFVKQSGSSDSVSIELTAAPQEGDSDGETSQFTGQLPDSLIGKPLDVTIPNLRIDGERFRVGFSTAATGASARASHDAHMPERADDSKQRELYLTPGGKYTSADIAANGNMTAAQKFKGIPSAHDLKPAEGDRICPVTLTKANPAFTWIVDGKSYQFCCPPCVDEFVKMAKENPDDLKAPEEYVK